MLKEDAEAAAYLCFKEHADKAFGGAAGGLTQHIYELFTKRGFFYVCCSKFKMVS